jgi:pimeloyl-ACP methyl ester carboxylesterase
VSTWIFLRGLARESGHWGGFPDVFRRHVGGADIVAIDLPGSGRLHAARSPSSVEAMAEHCRRELAGRDLAPPYHVLAMSLGAMVGVAWAASHPDELRGCVLINTSLRPYCPFYRRLRPASYPALCAMLAGASERARQRAILRLTSRRLAPDAPVLDDWVAIARDRPVSRANALRQLLAAARYRAPSNRPATPLLVLTSARDALVDPRCSQALARRWGAAIAVHPEAGHDIPLDDPEWVAEQVRRWL